MDQCPAATKTYDDLRQWTKQKLFGWKTPAEALDEILR